METAGGGGGSFGAAEESAATGVRRAKRRDSRTEDRRRAALTSPRGLSAPPPGWAGLGAEARASVGSQGEDWGWRCEHSLKGLVHHSEPGGSPGKSLQLPKRQETFSSLFVSWCARRGDSEHRLNELQRRARAAAISADPTAIGAQREKRRDSRTEDRRQAALTSPRGLSAHPPGRAGLGAEARASEVGSQGEDWGW